MGNYSSLLRSQILVTRFLFRRIIWTKPWRGCLNDIWRQRTVVNDGDKERMKLFLKKVCQKIQKCENCEIYLDSSFIRIYLSTFSHDDRASEYIGGFSFIYSTFRVTQLKDPSAKGRLIPILFGSKEYESIGYFRFSILKFRD